MKPQLPQTLVTPDPTAPALLFNEDCVEGCKRHIPDESVDLIIADPPYGIAGQNLHKHYNRKEEFVLDGYIEVASDEYAEFSRKWIAEAVRILRPGGSLYVVSGYTHLIDVLNALAATSLQEVNHIVWKYNFGVYTRRKYISSHYHILYYVKPGGRATFNAFCRFGADESDGSGSLNYRDREDVWAINREYQPGRTKNKNTLPSALLAKMILYSSNENDLVCDLFLGRLSTAKVAIGLNRRVIGFEKSRVAFDHQMTEMSKIRPGHLLAILRKPETGLPARQGQPWSDDEERRVAERYFILLSKHGVKAKAIDQLREFGRGKWALQKLLKPF